MLIGSILVRLFKTTICATTLCPFDYQRTSQEVARGPEKRDRQMPVTSSNSSVSSGSKTMASTSIDSSANASPVSTTTTSPAGKKSKPVPAWSPATSKEACNGSSDVLKITSSKQNNNQATVNGHCAALSDNEENNNKMTSLKDKQTNNRKVDKSEQNPSSKKLENVKALPDKNVAQAITPLSNGHDEDNGQEDTSKAVAVKAQFSSQPTTTSKTNAWLTGTPRLVPVTSTASSADLTANKNPTPAQAANQHATSNAGVVNNQSGK